MNCKSAPPYYLKKTPCWAWDFTLVVDATKAANRCSDENAFTALDTTLKKHFTAEQTSTFQANWKKMIKAYKEEGEKTTDHQQQTMQSQLNIGSVKKLKNINKTIVNKTEQPHVFKMKVCSAQNIEGTSSSSTSSITTATTPTMSSSSSSSTSPTTTPITASSTRMQSLAEHIAKRVTYFGFPAIYYDTHWSKKESLNMFLRYWNKWGQISKCVEDRIERFFGYLVSENKPKNASTVVLEDLCTDTVLLESDDEDIIDLCY
ncbi:hypothetical protein MBANPS3_012283 [Mucor bainieri]